MQTCKRRSKQAKRQVYEYAHTHTHGGNKEITKHKPETKATNQTFRLNEKENMHSRVISCLWMCWKKTFSVGQGKKPLVPQATDMFLNHTPGDVATLSTEESSNHPSQKPRLRFEKCTIMYRKKRDRTWYNHNTLPSSPSKCHPVAQLRSAPDWYISLGILLQYLMGSTVWFLWHWYCWWFWNPARKPPGLQKKNV